MTRRRETISADDLAWAAQRLKAVAHPVRLAILEAVEEKPRRVSDIVERVGQPQAAVSQHLAVLRTRGVLKSTRHGQEVYYEPEQPSITGVLDCIRRSLCRRGSS